MKKSLLFPSLCALILLAGCGSPSAPPAASEPAAPPTPPAVSEPAPAPAPEVISYTVTTLTEENSLHAEDGTLLLTTRYQLPSLSAHREDGSAIEEAKTEAEEAALATAATFNEKFTNWSNEEDFGGGNIADIAKESYDWCIQEGLDWFEGYALDLNCSTYQTDRMISVVGLYYSYTGGAHPNSVYLAWNFDLENGAFFTPETLGDSPEFQLVVTEELIRQCKEQIKVAEQEGWGSDIFWPDYETILADWQSYAVSFDGENMIVSFSPYELAAYAAGPQIFSIPYSFLEPYLSLQGMELLGLAEKPGA